METYAARLLDIEVINTTGGFAALEEEWEELYEECPSATPFQSWAWLYSWWEHYGEDYKLQLVVVRNEQGLLVGILPLMIERGGLRRLLFIGTGEGAYLDVLARSNWEEQVARAGVRALKQMNFWQVADFQDVYPEAAAWSLLSSWSGLARSIWQESCPIIETKSYDELLSTLSKRSRNNFRRAIRRAEEDGVRVELADETEAGRAARRLVDLHRESWKGRDITTEHLTRRWEFYIEAAARRMTARGLGAVSEFWQDGEVIASQLLVFGRELDWAFTCGASQEARRRYQVSSLWNWDSINVALSRNQVGFNPMPGEQQDKWKLSTKIVPIHRVILGRNRMSWELYTRYQVHYPQAKRYVRRRLESETTPQWLRNAGATTIARYRRLRNITKNA